MADNSPTFPELVKEVATINRWENGKTTPFKLARGQFDAFCKKMTAQGKLHLGNSSEK